MISDQSICYQNLSYFRTSCLIRLLGQFHTCLTKCHCFLTFQWGEVAEITVVQIESVTLLCSGILTFCRKLSPKPDGRDTSNDSRLFPPNSQLTAQISPVLKELKDLLLWTRQFFVLNLIRWSVQLVDKRWIVLIGPWQHILGLKIPSLLSASLKSSRAAYSCYDCPQQL